MAEDTGGGLLGFFDRGYDPAAAYGGLLTEQPTRDAMLARALAGMAGAFGQGAMPSPYKGGTPFLATLGQAAQAAYAGQDELIKARTQAAQGSLYGTQADVAKANLEANRELLKLRMKSIARDDAAPGGPGAATGATGGPAGVLEKSGFLNMTPPPADAGVPVDQSAHFVGTDYLHSLAQAAAPHALPPGYTVEMTSDVRPNATVAGTGGRSQHADANAADFVIKDDKGQAIPNKGEDVTGNYGRLALTMRMLADPMLKERLAWGGNFTTGGDNAPKDLMHFDLGKDRGRYGTLGAMEAAYQANLARNAPNASNLPVQSAGAAGPVSSLLAMPDPSYYSGALSAPPGANPPPPAPAAPAPLAPHRPESLLGPQPGAPPIPAQAGVDAGRGLLGPQIPEAVAALAQQAAGRPGQVAGPGAPDPAAPAPSPAGPTLLQGGGARPPIAPTVGPMPVPSLLSPPAPIMPTQQPIMPPGAQPGAAPPMPVRAGPGAPAVALPPGAPSPQQIQDARRDMALSNFLKIPIDPLTLKNATYNIDISAAAAKAAAEARATQPITQENAAQQARVNAQYQLWVKQNEPQLIRKGTIYKDPVSGRVLQNPDDVKTVDKDGNEFLWQSYPSLTPGAAPTLVPVGMAKLGPEATRAAETRGTFAGAPPGAGIPGNPIFPGINPGGIDPARPIPSPANTSRPYQTSIPAVTNQAHMPEYSTYGKAQSEWIKESAELSEAGVLAQRAELNMQQIGRAFTMIETGAWERQKQEFGGYLKSMGIPVPERFNQLDAVQEALHNNYKAQLATLAAATKKFTGGEYKVNVEAGTQPNIQPKANLVMLSSDIGLARQLQSLATDWNHAQTMVATDGSKWVNPVSFKTAWTNENPLSRFVDVTQREIAPTMKGIGNEPPPQTYKHPEGGTYPSRMVPDGKGGYKQQYLRPN